MGTNSSIEWCDHTWSVWRGCTKVVGAEECVSCYAERMSKTNPKALGYWGEGAMRVCGVDSYWQLPLKQWDKRVQPGTRKHRVFVNSLSDFCEDHIGTIVRAGSMERLPVSLDDLRKRAIEIMACTENLNFMILTKRPHNLTRDVPVRDNIWVGCTCGTLWACEHLLPKFLESPRYKVRFLSVEPMLDDVSTDTLLRHAIANRMIDWVIIGCESRGPNVGRLLGDKMEPGSYRFRGVEEWREAAQRLIQLCDDAGVAVFAKQVPTWVERDDNTNSLIVDSGGWAADFKEFPDDGQSWRE